MASDKKNNSKLKRQGIAWIYERFFAEQEGACALCKRADLELELDHDHECCTGSRRCGNCFRGLLCHGCNIRMGQFDAALKGALLASDRVLSLILGYYPREAEYVFRYLEQRQRQEEILVFRYGRPPE
jgi:hypothetical protein